MNPPVANCPQCRHYYVTWDPKAPRGCRLHGFKSQAMPSQVVRHHSGHECLAFEPKPAPASPLTLTKPF